MYCTLCRKQFESWIRQRSFFREAVNHLCEDCFNANPESPLKGKMHQTTFCIACGDVLPKTPKKQRNNKIILTSMFTRYCKVCKSNRTQKTCEICGKENKGSGYKYCNDCKTLQQKNRQESLAILNRKSSIEWAKRNPEKVRASKKVRYRKDLAQIHYECPCESDNKIFHHYDYDKPYDVILLCYKCHVAEHKRLRDLAYNQGLPIRLY